MNYTNPSFFLMGIGRSGTTLLMEIINASGQAWLSPGCHWLPELLQTRRQFLELYKENDRHYASGEKEKIWFKAIRDMNRTLCRRSNLWGMQTLGHRPVQFAEAIKDVYPESKIVFLLRDPRDIFLSVLRVGTTYLPHHAANFLKTWSIFSAGRKGV
ncbi:MAG: sulfotransferase, partial [Deltaproteobacteria bacterium]|nr:sulfotransferase [Deltaproteobacteria bacterium]